MRTSTKSYINMRKHKALQIPACDIGSTQEAKTSRSRLLSYPGVNLLFWQFVNLALRHLLPETKHWPGRGIWLVAYVVNSACCCQLSATFLFRCRCRGWLWVWICSFRGNSLGQHANFEVRLGLPFYRKRACFAKHFILCDSPPWRPLVAAL